MSRGRRLQLLGVVLALAGVSIVLTAPGASASGGAQDPPGWTDPGNGAWVTFTVSPTTVAPIGRTGNYAPVTITRHDNLGVATLAQSFGGWPMQDFDGDPNTPPELGWPDTFSGGGVSLHRVAPCRATQTSCQYQVDDAGPFFFAGGTPLDALGAPDFSVFGSPQQMTKLPPQQIVATLTYTKGGPGELGKLTLDGSGSHDPLGGTLTFSWTITSQDPNNPKIWTGTGNVLTQAITDPGTYCINLNVVSSVDGASMPAGQQCITFTDGEVPAKPVSLPSGGGATAPAPSNTPIATVSFAKPSRNAPSVFGGGPSSPTVVWLWRPDFYQASPDSKIPRTAGTPKLTGKSEILVSTKDGPEGASAGPWLGGLAAFGLLGGAFLFSRRRKMLRMEP